MEAETKNLPPILPPNPPPAFHSILPLASFSARAIKERLARRHGPIDWPVYATTLTPAILELGDVFAPAVQEDEAPPAFEPLPVEPVDVRQARDARRERAKAASFVGQWTPELVDLWLTEAFRVLIRLPIPTRPKGHGSMMPAYMVEFADQVAQAENRTLRKMRAQMLRRFGAPSAEQTRRMDDALAWQVTYLKSCPDKRLPMYVGLGALWRACRRNIKVACKQQIGEWPSTFYRIRKEGLVVIAAGLKRDGRVAT